MKTTVFAGSFLVLIVIMHLLLLRKKLKPNMHTDIRYLACVSVIGGWYVSWCIMIIAQDFEIWSNVGYKNLSNLQSSIMPNRWRTWVLTSKQEPGKLLRLGSFLYLAEAALYPYRDSYRCCFSLAAAAALVLVGIWTNNGLFHALAYIGYVVARTFISFKVGGISIMGALYSMVACLIAAVIVVSSFNDALKRTVRGGDNEVMKRVVGCGIALGADILLGTFLVFTHFGHSTWADKLGAFIGLAGGIAVSVLSVHHFLSKMRS